MQSRIAGKRAGALLVQIGFPVFARGLCIQGTGKDFTAHGPNSEPIQLGDTTDKRGYESKGK